jgi:hypothetical protein
VVVVMLMLPAVVAWGPRFEVPLYGPEQTVGHALARATDGDELADAARAPSTLAAAPGGPRAMWTVVTALYLAGMVLLLARLATGAWRLRAIRRAAVVEGGRLTHPACVTPITLGILGPVVILPSGWASWGAAEASAVLAHEEEHVRRRDPLIMALALVNRAIFWFHPLAWWLPRELSRLSEQVCDAAVIARGHDRGVYASSLVRFARLATASGGRVMRMAVPMSGTGLRERLRMMADPQAPLSRARRLAVAGLCATLIALSAMAVPAAAQRPAAVPGQTPWPVVTSEHFELLHPGLPPDRVGGAVQDAEAAYRQLSAALRYEIPWRVSIILVNREGDLPATAAGARALALQSGASNRPRIVLALESLEQRPDLVVHELTHQFAFEIVPRTSRRAPLLIEGLAEYQRGAWRADDLRATRGAVAAGAIPSVATLDDDSRSWAHAVFDYVAAEYGADGVRRLMFALRAEDTLAPAVPLAFGVTLDQFDQGFRDYLTARFDAR